MDLILLQEDVAIRCGRGGFGAEEEGFTDGGGEGKKPEARVGEEDSRSAAGFEDEGFARLVEEAAVGVDDDGDLCGREPSFVGTYEEDSEASNQRIEARFRWISSAGASRYR